MSKSWCESIVAVLIIAFALMQSKYSQLYLVLLGIVLLIHSLSCKSCFACCAECDSKKNAETVSKKKK